MDILATLLSFVYQLNPAPTNSYPTICTSSPELITTKFFLNPPVHTEPTDLAGASTTDVKPLTPAQLQEAIKAHKQQRCYKP